MDEGEMTYTAAMTYAAAAILRDTGSELEQVPAKVVFVILKDAFEAGERYASSAEISHLKLLLSEGNAIMDRMQYDREYPRCWEDLQAWHLRVKSTLSPSPEGEKR